MQVTGYQENSFIIISAYQRQGKYGELPTRLVQFSNAAMGT
jgi:hypothetical protein